MAFKMTNVIQLQLDWVHTVVECKVQFSRPVKSSNQAS